MKKVAIIFRMDQPGGVQSCIISLIKGLNRKGIVPDILWDLPVNKQILIESGVIANYQYVKFNISSRLIDIFPDSLRYFARIFNTLHEKDLGQQYDFVFSFYNGIIFNTTPHLYYLSGPPLIPQLSKAPKGILGIPYHVFKFLYQKFLCKNNPVYEYHKESRYFINSEYTANLFLKAHGVEIPVLYPPINISNSTFEDTNVKGRDTILFFSRIVDYKRPELFLEIAKAFPQFRAVIMGGVSINRRKYFITLQRLSSDLKLDNVEFFDNPSTLKVHQELSRSLFYIFPAKNEHFGMTTPEAIASGAIPFVHNSGGQIEIVSDSLLRFEDHNYIEKFLNLTNLSNDELINILHKLIANLKCFSEENYISEMIKCLDNLN